MGFLHSLARRQRNRRRHQSARRPVVGNVQRLEDRTLLTGNVDVLLSGRDVSLIGDDADNQIVIEQMNNWVIVRGINGTTVGGMNEYLLSGVPFFQDDVSILMGGGDDVVIIANGISVRDSLRIDTGDGNDTVQITGATIFEDLVIDTGAGDDTVLIRNTEVFDDLAIFAGSGNNNVSVVNTRITDDFVLHTGNGNDNVAVMGTTVGDRNEVLTFGGDDITDILPANDARFLPGEDALGSIVDPDAIDDVYDAPESTLVVNAINGLGANDFRSAVLGSTGISLETSPQRGSVTVGLDGSFTYTPDAEFVGGTDTFNYRLANSFGGYDIATVTIVRQDLTLTLDDLSMNTGVAQSNGTLVTETEAFTVSGTTTPFAVVDVDRDGDGAFDDGSVTADVNGIFSVVVTLIHDDNNMGANGLEVRSTVPGINRELTETVDVHYAIGTVTRFNSSLGAFDVELLDDDAPITVANFMNYFDDYDNTIIHRALLQDFVIQGGGFVYDGAGSPEVTKLTPDAAIANEFNAANSNVIGTLSMALAGGIDTGTSQWFFNTVNNTQLDTAKHTVFGRVIGTGMDVVQAIEDLNPVNLNGVFPETALSTVPLDNYLSVTEMITGSVSVDAGSSEVTGVGTSFTTELQATVGTTPGSVIRIGTEVFIVGDIIDDTHLTLRNLNSPDVDGQHPTSAQNEGAFVNAVPDEANFVIFESIGELFGP